MLKLRARHNIHQAVWLVEPGVKVGRLSSNDMILDAAGIADLQFVIGVRGDRMALKNRAPERPLTVNGQAVSDRCPIREGDVIALAEVELEVVDPKKEAGHSPAATGWSLKANSAALANRVFQLGESSVIGRSRECDIHLALAHLSRRHAQLTVVEGLLYVKDLGSSNGTFLNGHKVTEARVRRGDELRFDTLSFGVLGPVDDLDKTSVRPRAEQRRPTQRPVPRSPSRSREESPARRVEPVAARTQTVEAQPVRRGWVGGLVLLLLLCAVAGFWWLG